MRAQIAEADGQKQLASNEWYLVECLTTLKDIYDSGDCNNCKIHKDCPCPPGLGKLVRFNCPHYISEEENDDGRGYSGETTEHE